MGSFCKPTTTTTNTAAPPPGTGADAASVRHGQRAKTAPRVLTRPVMATTWRMPVPLSR